MEVVNALGRRKSAIARIFVSEGTGKITINKRDLAEYFPSSILQYVVKQPLNKLGVAEKYDIKVNLCGGGFTGQSQALRLAIARALVKINAEDKAALRAEGFMTRDPRLMQNYLHADCRTAAPRLQESYPRTAKESCHPQPRLRHQVL